MIRDEDFSFLQNMISRSVNIATLYVFHFHFDEKISRQNIFSILCVIFLFFSTKQANELKHFNPPKKRSIRHICSSAPWCDVSGDPPVGAALCPQAKRRGLMTPARYVPTTAHHQLRVNWALPS